MRVLVTGGAGFIGSNFVHRLSYLGYDVVVLDALTYAGRLSNLQGAKMTFLRGDIRDPRSVRLAMDGADAVVHFAAETHVDRSIKGHAREFVSTNVCGTANLLEAARVSAPKLSRFMMISTDEVYGEVLTGAASEDWPMNPRNPYAASKAGAELLAHSYYVTYGLPVVVTRSVNNFGPNQFPEKLIPVLVKKALAGQPLPIFDSGDAERDWLHVDDHVEAIRLLMDPILSGTGNVEGEIFNVGANNHMKAIDVARMVVEEVGTPGARIEFIKDARPGHDQRYAVDSRKLRRLVHWAPKKNDQLRAVIRHYVEEARDGQAQ